MKVTWIIVISLVIGMLGTAGVSAADPGLVQGYIKIGTATQGAGTVSPYEDYSEILGFSHEVAADPASSGGGGGTGRAYFNLTITKPVDKATPRLFLLAANRQNTQTATIVFKKSGQGYTITLNNVVITGVSQSYDPLDPVQPGVGEDLEVVRLSFGKIRWKYGTVQTGWNVGTNSAA
ncbi:MAG: type VI secretion system tube protein Hcp [Methanoregulaceae archaeon]|nr:type VI secretion system tube protein Hcp [Methanoregulaceae archaeon]